MKKKVTTLTEDFNAATIRSGEEFQISLPEGGRAGWKWDDVHVVSGAATLLDAPDADRTTGCTGPFSAEWSYRAETSGDIEIEAKSNRGHKCTFKVHVN